MNILKRLALTLFVSTISSPWMVGASFAADPAFTVDTRTTSATVTSKNASGVTARVSTSFDVPSRYRNQFPRNSTRYVQVPKLRVIEGAKTAARGSMLNLGLLAAVAGAGWVIDELTGQISKPTQVQTSDYGYGDGDIYVPGHYFSYYGDRYLSPTLYGGIKTRWPDVIILEVGPRGSCGNNCYAVRYIRPGYSTWYQASVILKENPTNCTADYCTAPSPVTVEELLPVSQQQLESELWPHIQALPNHVLAEAFAPNPLNTPEIAADLAQQYAEIAANNPNLAYDPATNTFTYTDPDTGEQVSTNPNADPDLNPLDLPDDYARENTLAESVTLLSSLKDLLVDSVGMPDELIPEDYEYQGTTFDTMGTDMTLVPEPPSLNFMPNLPQYSSSCQQLTLNWKGHSVQFPDDNQCSKLGNAKTIIGYMLYVLTAFGIAHVVLTPRGAT